MSPEQPQTHPISILISSADKLRQNIELLRRPEWLGHYDNLIPEFKAVSVTLSTLTAYHNKYQENIASIDARLKTVTVAAQRNPIEREKQRLESEAIAFYLKLLPRFSTELHELCEVMLTEYHTEHEKITLAIQTPEEADRIRSKFQENLKEIDEFSPIIADPKTPLEETITEWEEYVFQDESSDIYDVFTADSPDIRRIHEVPAKFQPSVTLMHAACVFDTVADQVMELFQNMKDLQSLRKRTG